MGYVAIYVACQDILIDIFVNDVLDTSGIMSFLLTLLRKAKTKNGLNF